MRVQRWAAAARAYVVHLGRETSVHGVSHLVATDRHPVEVVLWAISIVVAVLASVLLTMSSYRRFQEQPTVVSLEKDYQNWQNLFPAITVCYNDRLDKKAAAAYISRKWANVSDKKDYYMNFLSDVANISLSNLAAFTKYKEDHTLYGIADEMKSIATEQTHMRYAPTKRFQNKLTHEEFEKVFTEFGLCYSLGSAIAVALEPINPTKQKELSEPWKCNSITDQLCYGHLQFTKKTTLKVYVHSPYEIADVGTWSVHLEGNRVLEVMFKNFQLVASKEVFALSVRQRGCVAYDKKRNLPYSINICKMSCRARHARSLCGCVPYFYSTLDIWKVAETQKLQEQNKSSSFLTVGGIGRICDVRGLACLAPHANDLIHLTDKGGRPISCDCVTPCETVHYTLSKVKDNVLKSASKGFTLNGLVFKWSISPYNKSRYKREALYTFEDLLVSLGGTAALFLGCSLLSAVEVVYLLTLRLICLYCASERSPEIRRRKNRRLKWLEKITHEIL